MCIAPHIVGRWLAAAAAFGLSASGSATAQALSEAEAKAFGKSRIAQGEGRYLDAASALRPVAFDDAGKPSESYAYQAWREAMGLMTAEPPPRADEGRSADPGMLDEIDAAIAADAIEEIVRRARETSIVFLNEDHGVPRSRAFALRVARALRPLGYSVLAVETLSNQADTAAVDERLDRIERQGHLQRFDGFYSRDPVFADFLRQAIAMGYELEAYETTERERGEHRDPALSIPKREQAQADYLLNRALNRHPGAKLLVYVGFSHATEAPITGYGDRETWWVAARIKAMTGIDPLTIDQATLMRDGTTSTPATLIDAAAAKAGNRSGVLMRDGAPLVLGQYRGAVDLQVVHPDVPRVAGRPGWLATAMARTPTPVPQELLPAQGTRLIQAFVEGEGDDAIPVDQVLVRAGEAAPNLVLPEAPVRYAVQNGATNAE